MPQTPPSKWFAKLIPSLRKNPKYAKYSPDRLQQIAAGIWHGFSDEKKQSLTRKLEKNSPDMPGIIQKTLDFGGYSSQNADWERGYREGERKQEDRQRGIELQRSRKPQFVGKAVPLTYTSRPKDEVRKHQKEEVREGLRYRAGEQKEQHQGVGTVLAAPERSLKVPPLVKAILLRSKMGDTEAQTMFQEEKAQHPSFSDAQVWQIVKDHLEKKQIILIKRFSVFMPISCKTATQTVGEVHRGDLVVEGFVSMPIKDLQGDILEKSALVRAKQECVSPPHNLVWLHHNSPYAKPMEHSETPPVGKFVKSAILNHRDTTGNVYPSLWVRMLVNKTHPEFKTIAYELKNGFLNAFSMEFVPVREGMKYVGGKLANAVSDIKYYATSLVRAPANEGATVCSVYTKAFANSTRFSPVQIAGPGWLGQSVRRKEIGEFGNLDNRARLKEAEPEGEPEAEPEGEPEEEPGMDEQYDQAPPRAPPQAPPQRPPQNPLGMRTSRKDYDRQTGSTAPERSTTGIGEWGDPALEKGRAVMKDVEARRAILAQNRKMSTMEKMLKMMAANTALIGKSLGLDMKGIDESTDESLDWGGEAPGSSEIDEQDFPEVAPGVMGKPPKQRVIAGVEMGTDEDVTEVGDQQVKGLERAIVNLARKAVDAQISRKIVVRKGIAEFAGLVPENVSRIQRMKAVDGSIDSQLALIDEYGH